MSRLKSILSVMLCIAMALPLFGQTPSQTPEIKGSSNRGVFYSLTKNYQPTTVAAISFDDSQRIERLIRAGHLYLSLRDAIALALENNLDIEVARLNPKIPHRYGGSSNVAFQRIPGTDMHPRPGTRTPESA